jgi:type II secretory pathway component PulF
MSRITAEGQFVVDLKEEKAGAGPSQDKARKGKVTRSDIALFTRRLADLSEAGLPLDRVLQVIAEQSESITLSEVATEALGDVRGGMAVSEALAKHPKLFPQVFAETLRAGESSGQLPEVASRLADFQEKEVTRRSQVTSALIYPVVLSVVAVLAVVTLITFVIPKLTPVFTDLGADLPAPTKLLLAISGFLTNNGLVIIGGIVALVVAYRMWAATDAGAYARDAIALRLPAVGSLVRKSTVSRFSRVLGTLVFGGVPILDAIHLSGRASGNKVFEKASKLVEDDVREGRQIADAMRDAGGFPPVLTHMVAIGEETGNLPKMLSRVSDALDFEVDNGLRRFVALVEPVIILVLAFVVGFVVLSVVLPIFEAQNAVK